jgi:hypothetical protein
MCYSERVAMGTFPNAEPVFSNRFSTHLSYS